ncbi:glycosyl hydrolase [Devosia yakushimensis]|uniref:Glycosyl hydrolase n=1 Tax=Devosia yakushimensis TaxID=470028 RepID=A0ABQ5UJ35_9HYPH|nr:exo-alpha-sialidase [Devosia yakushimensis]GLQ11623.1 glycosyl hydrolase [Devosia yakushimensis]
MSETVTLTTDGALHPVAGDAIRQEGFLPSHVQQTHASFLLQLRNGDLGCVWFAGTEEGKPDVSIYFSRLPKGSDQWTAEEKLSDDPARSEQNPVLFEAPNGDLWVLYTSQDFGNQDTSIVRRRISKDGGKSWGPIQSPFDETGLFIRNPIIVLANGNWLLPVFHCNPVPGEKWHGHNDTSGVKISTDQGESWTEYAVPESVGAVHMNIVDLKNGSLVAFYRSRYADAIYASHSTDNGRSWSKPEPTDLPNNNSSIQARALSDGTLALVYNEISAKDSTDRREGLYDGIDDGKAPVGEKTAETQNLRRAVWGTPRSPMTIALSSDGGKTWPIRRNIEVSSGSALSNDTSGKEHRNRELSYPTVTELEDGRIGVAYTFYRRAIKFVRFPRSWVSAA